MLHGVATQTRHAGQRRLIIISAYVRQAAVQAVLTRLADFLSLLKATAEQLTDAQRLRDSCPRVCHIHARNPRSARPVDRSIGPNLKARLLYLGLEVIYSVKENNLTVVFDLGVC
ncbi:hypothetical protein SAMN05216404_101280 [Nitrosospira multiformis]|uniref:Uncharacterized protein n=1 Tax=Nitrosospira multiformis TaxID=1231 RepID=A0A1H8BN54_9PROT|nr:hypothetical protein [Nitrosospira multiformis]SEM83327.1 hypothetical protein SAMN05216404_101280 [Nitrosospira multiformis]